MGYVPRRNPRLINCDLRIIRAKNVETKSGGQLFVRCFLPVGNNRRVRIDTHEIMLNSSPDLVWDQSFSLECHDNTTTKMTTTSECNNFMSGMLLVVELRLRSMVPLLGKIRGSRLLGRAEIPWKIVMNSPQMKMEKWLIMTSSCGKDTNDIVKTPAVQISLGVTIPTINCPTVDVESRRRRRRSNEMAKGEEHCGWDMSSSISYELLAISAAFDVL